MRAALVLLFVFPALLSASPCASGLARHRAFDTWKAQAETFAITPPRKVATHLPVLVIGAGPAGLAALKSVREAGLPVEGVEKAAGPGGLWDLENRSSPAYYSLRTNSSTATTHLGDPHVEGTSPFLSQYEALRYLRLYARRHGLTELIRFKTEVQTLSKQPDGTWNATLVDANGNAEERPYRAVIVASGRHNRASAQVPQELLNLFAGTPISVLHASEYRMADRFVGRRVIVVGAGNSGAEIATELSSSARRTILSIRSTPWVVPESVFGTPADEFAQSSPGWVPHALEDLVFNILVRWYVGQPRSIGLGTPDHRLLEKLPIVERGLRAAIRNGRLQVRSPIRSADRLGVVQFQNIREAPEEIDSVILATGYRQIYPFLPPGIIDADGPDPELPFWLFHPTQPELLFMYEISVPQGVWPVFAAQARTAADYLLAQQNQTSNYRRLLQMNRHVPNPDFKGHLFGRAPQRFVDAQIYTRWLGQLGDWVKN